MAAAMRDSSGNGPGFLGTLYLVRHGETVGSEKKCYKGSIDVPLSTRGIEQIKATSDFLAGLLRRSAGARYLSCLKDIHGIRREKPGGDERTLATVYCSGLSRAVKSAEIIAAPYGLTPVVIPDLRERGFGIWEGMTFTEIMEKYPVEFEAWAGDPLRYSPIDGESTVEVRDRVLGALEKILEESQNSPSTTKNIAVVAHGGVNRIILCHLMGIPLGNIFRIEQDLGAVNIIEFWERYPVVKRLNIVPFSPEDGKGAENG